MNHDGETDDDLPSPFPYSGILVSVADLWFGWGSSLLFVMREETHSARVSRVEFILGSALRSHSSTLSDEGVAGLPVAKTTPQSTTQ
ncbi:uncharacterized protein BO96DRAFT_405302 [Aspergillus niger CBS 101883]|uniref:Contig An01c0170, genomic contig n=2 Tax=Aspergillus niger TaxID=5061 RepID=A2Q8N8_ASPNC|nr:uncharacterized protein BO96DRAFT_405302 [Aspergillus niger CBS 101883]XP_059599655.1 uncharacterized protein An01g05010 [Aspergillus niger]PYH50845.1 hypothetical protein BO96DRAFT_405302 [Aspergillus niger CBS 101883]CAK37035.1 unnamed protein product [Aspergillus niger]